MEINNQVKFQFDAQMALNNLIETATKKYEYNELHQLSYDLGSAFSSSIINLLNRVFDNKEIIDEAFREMIESCIAGIVAKKVLLDNPTDKLVVFNEPSSTLQ